MRYTQGDILICFKTRTVYKYTGAESTMYSVITTNSERENFDKTGKNIMSFTEFKKICPDTDLRKKYRIYDTVHITENTFLLMRQLKIKMKYPTDNEGLLNIIFHDYLKNKLQQKRQEPFEQRKSIVISELKELLKKIENL
jgi:hypothetical protein